MVMALRPPQHVPLAKRLFGSFFSELPTYSMLQFTKLIIDEMDCPSGALFQEKRKRFFNQKYLTIS